jgi:hydrogenase maturation protease
VKNSLVLGIGNVLLTDDGAGVHAARQLGDRLAGREDVQVLDGGTLSFTLAPLIAGATRLIVLDATELHQAPGSVQCFVDAGMDELLRRARLTVHEIGLRDVLEISALAGELPRERALIGIQPASLAWGVEPTPAVAAALQVVAQSALELLEHWPNLGRGAA